MKYYKGTNEIDAQFYYRWHHKNFANNKAITMYLHMHQSAEIIIVTSGEITIKISGGESETVGEGQSVFIPPFTPHSYVTKEGTEFFRCNFASSLVPDFFNFIDGKKAKENVFTVNSATVLLLGKRLIEDNDMSRWNVRAFLYSVINDFFASVTLTESDFDSNILIKAVSYMDRNKAKAITIGDVARDIGYSKSHLSYCLNKAASTNFSTLLAMLRIESARMLLKNTKKSILEISMECGFGSERSFYRQFKSIAGISPKDYRKSQEFRVISTGSNNPYEQ